MRHTLIALPCTAQELENALHAVCDHDGLWDLHVGWRYDALRRSASLVLYSPPCASASASRPPAPAQTTVVMDDETLAALGYKYNNELQGLVRT